jgi:hypothetical protein
MFRIALLCTDLHQFSVACGSASVEPPRGYGRD